MYICASIFLIFNFFFIHLFLAPSGVTSILVNMFLSFLIVRQRLKMYYSYSFEPWIEVPCIAKRKPSSVTLLKSWKDLTKHRMM
uniref:Uncharacterized protein n=1 Tax=Anguilla anguilla TaxID=7936 RepID=A0A0E9X0L1_ANGAN